MMASSRNEKAKLMEGRNYESEPGSGEIDSGSSDEEQASKLAMDMRRKVKLESFDFWSQDS